MKNYFFLTNIDWKLTGIERAVINRYRLFREIDEECFICTIRFNTSLEQKLGLYDVERAHVINLFRYYQKLPENLKKETVENIKINNPDWKFIEVKRTNDFRVYNQNGQYIIYLACFKNGNIHYLNYFNQFKKKYKRSIYDEYGNLACEMILNHQHQVICEKYLNANGQTVIEIFNHYDEEKKITAVHLYEDNEALIFSSMDEFVAHWMDELANKGNSLFYIDRNGFYAPVVNLMQSSVPIYAVIHSVHTKSVIVSNNGPLNFNYEKILTNYEKYEGVIVSTQLQKQHIETRFKQAFPITVIPVGYTEQRKRIPIINRTENKIVIPSRFSGEKQLHLVVDVIQGVKDKVPNIKVHFFGFNTGKENILLQIKELIKERKLEEYFEFHDFTSNIHQEFEDASAYLLTSRGEGFCLTLLEALSCGVPSIVFNVMYGPADMIHHQLNGFLVERNDVEAMKQALLTLLLDEGLKQRMSDSAYEWSNLFSKESLKVSWKQLINKHKIGID